MKSKYMMGLMCAFCFGVLGKTALDAVGYEVVASARADVAGMNSRALLRDRDFRRAVASIVEGGINSLVPSMIDSELGWKVPDMIRSEVSNCTVYVDGDYGSLDC